jgi:sugar phosphate isomerase/epimerase
MGKRTQNIHFKEFSKNGTDFSLETFRPLLDGTTNWPAVMEELNKIGYKGYLTFEFPSLSSLPGSPHLSDLGFVGSNHGKKRKCLDRRGQVIR